MKTFTSDGLKELMREVVDQPADLDDDFLDTSFADLGYDSLSLLEIASRIQLEYGVNLPDETIATIETPRAMVTCVQALPVLAGELDRAGE